MKIFKLKLEAIARLYYIIIVKMYNIIYNIIIYNIIFKIK